MYIEVNKELIPYRFEMEFDNGIFEFELNYNSSYDFFTVDLYKDEQPIILAEKIVYAKELFGIIKKSDPEKVPNVTIFPIDATGAPLERIDWDNLGVTVQLYIARGDE